MTGNLIIGCDLHVMIHVTYEPLEGILVIVAGPFPMDMYTWGMINSDLHGDKIPQMDDVTPTRGRETPKTCTRKKKGRCP